MFIYCMCIEKGMLTLGTPGVLWVVGKEKGYSFRP